MFVCVVCVYVSLCACSYMWCSVCLYMCMIGSGLYTSTGHLPGLGDSHSGPHTCEAGESFCSVNTFPELFAHGEDDYKRNTGERVP